MTIDLQTANLRKALEIICVSAPKRPSGKSDPFARKPAALLAP
jgi:hypothetical protein